MSETPLAKVGVVLPAGGKGLRLASALPKQFMELLPGRPLFLYALETFHALAEVTSVVLVLPTEAVEGAAVWKEKFPKLILVEGGEERWLSVRAGVEALPLDVEIVLVHDVARPFVNTRQIRAVVESVRQGVAATLAQPCTDTIKRIHGQHIVETLDRKSLIGVQTPQGFSRALLNMIYGGLDTNGLPETPPTDECMLAEHFGVEVAWVKGSAQCRKVTESEDWDWAQWMAKRILAGEVVLHV